MIGVCLPMTALLHRFAEGKAVHARHFDIGDDEIEFLTGFGQLQRLVAAIDRRDREAGGGQLRCQQVAEEGAVVDHQHAA